MTSSEQLGRQIKVRLSEGQHDALVRAATAEDRPVGQYVRRLLARHLDFARSQAGADTAGA